MVDNAILEKRLNKLEKAIDDIQDRLDNRDNANNWLQKLTGSISDEETFIQALEYGYTYRKSDSPISNNDK
jgi:hypothetical protein